MVKSLILLVILSVVAIFLKSQIGMVLHWLVIAHNHIAAWLGVVFSHDRTGQYIQAILSLIVIPIAVGGVAALGFWIVKRSAMPHVLATIWIAWTILLVTMLARV